MQLRKIIFSGVILLTLAGALWWVFGFQKNNVTAIYFPRVDRQFQVQVARTETETAKGLSGRTSLAENEGMWFEFAEEAHRRFWMKDMEFAIDIIWLDGHKTIAGIEHRVPAPDLDVDDSELPRYVSPGNTQYVMEISSGVAEAVGLQIGDQAEVR